MRSHLTLLTTASALALALAVAAANAEPAEAPGAKSDITIAGDAVPSTGGMENSAAGQGADNRNTPATPQSGASSMSKRGTNSADQGGTGIKGSAQGEGVTNKSSANVPATGAGSQAGGPSTGTEPGTGVEDSAEGQGATNKAGKADMLEGKLPSSHSME